MFEKLLYLAKPSLDELVHYGVKRRSGRYPFGSGENPYQHSGDFLARVKELRNEGFEYTDETGKKWTGDTAIAKSFKLTTSQFRTQLSLANAERRSLEVDRAKSLREKGYSLNEIADMMGYKNDSSIRSLLNENAESRMKVAEKTADFLREQVDSKGIIDIGAGVEKELGISAEKLNQAVYMLEMEGYEVYGAGVPQPTNPGKQTNIKVLCPPGTEYKEVYNYEEVHSITDYSSHDDGETFDALQPPASFDSSRLAIRYGDEGGSEKDGVIEIRRGVDDLSLGESRYAQVRILVDGTHYLKGMAVYSDDLPDGVDILFNTNKASGTPVLGDKNNTVLKNIKDDPDNPFGALIKANGQSYYTDENGEKKLSPINKTREEGDWSEWSNGLSAQFLSKQSMKLINNQLSLAKADKQAEFDEINSLTNPTVKKKLLSSFADDCDAAAESLQAAALPRQRYKVILPVTSMKDTEIYAPDYENGEKVALVRYPHGGTFEIPILTVNNKNKEAKNVLGNADDAVGITKTVADRLSGADFDGDTVMVIPTSGNGKNTKVNIISTPELEGLKGFDPKLEYGGKAEGTFKVMRNTQTEMGKISNLVTDMNLKGATPDELAKAVRHSMVVIDAEKHHLDYQQSEKDNNIAYLKKKYQGHYDEDGNYHEGASTLISAAKSKKQVLKTVGSPKINEKGKPWYDESKPEGALVYKSVVETYVDKNGKTRTRMKDSTKMRETTDARTLSSGTKQEEAYADYANSMKALANTARKTILQTGKIEYSASANKTYANEVASLEADLNIALKNAPRERQAILLANSVVKAKKQANPDMSKKEIKKESQRALTAARLQVGAKRTTIKMTDKKWEAIQAGAISENKLMRILNHTDLDEIRKYATPKTTTQLSSAKQTKIRNMSNSGYTIAEIAESMGISTSTVKKYM